MALNLQLRTTGCKIQDVVTAMRDFKPTKDMSHHPSRKHSNRYDKEMDQAFTLIFHNIKRLQDGMLSNSDPDLTKEPSNFDLEPKTVKTIQKPVRKRSRSEDFRILGFGVQRTASPALIKSGSLQQLSDAAKSPFQRRKVRFADDNAVRESVKRSNSTEGRLVCHRGREAETLKLKTKESIILRQEETLMPLNDSGASKGKQALFVVSDI